MKASTGDQAQGFGLHRWPGGGDAGVTHRTVGGPGDQSRRGQCRVPSLGGSHTDRGIAFHQLDIPITQSRAVDDVLDLQIFIKIDKLAPFGVLEDRPGVVHSLTAFGRLHRARVQSQLFKGGPAGVAAIGTHRLQAVQAVDAAGQQHAPGQVAETEAGAIIVVAQLGATVTGQLIGGHIPRGHGQEATGDVGQVIPHRALVAAGMNPHGRQACATGIGLCFVHRGLGVEGYALLSQSRRQCRVVGSGAQVHQGGDRQARVQRGEGSAVSRVIAGEDHQWLLGCHAVVHQQALQGTAQQDAG